MTFKMKYSGSIIPIEEATLTDTTTNLDAVDSTIDATSSSGITISTTRNYRTAAASVISTTPSTVASLMGGLVKTAIFLYVKIISPPTGLTSKVTLVIGTFTADIVGTNNFVMIPMNNGISISSITLNGATGVSGGNVEIIIGTNN